MKLSVRIKDVKIKFDDEVLKSVTYKEYCTEAIRLVEKITSDCKNLYLAFKND
jgi:hypothetical protein